MATGLVLTLASLPLIFAFEAHVINVTAKIENCGEFEIRSRGYWKNHEEDWILPQTVGVILISTPEEAEDMLNANEDMTDKLERELLALKFNVAKFGVGDSLVPEEDITISELIAEADALLTADFPDPDPISDEELEDMKDRVEKTNNAKKVSPCKNPPPPPDDCDNDDDEEDYHDRNHRLRVTRVEAGGTVMVMTRGGGGHDDDDGDDDCDDSEDEDGHHGSDHHEGDTYVENNNDAVIENEVHVEADTGGNSANGGEALLPDAASTTEPIGEPTPEN